MPAGPMARSFARRWVHTESFVMNHAERLFYEKLREYLEDVDLRAAKATRGVRWAPDGNLPEDRGIELRRCAARPTRRAC